MTNMTVDWMEEAARGDVHAALESALSGVRDAIDALEDALEDAGRTEGVDDTPEGVELGEAADELERLSARYAAGSGR